MGQTISAVKEAIKGDVEKEKQAEGILNAMTELSNTQAKKPQSKSDASFLY